MASPSPSTPSEGEIVESHIEKAKPSINDVHDTNVDRHSRLRASVSPSPSPVSSPGLHRSRTRSRSPYREPRGAKRTREDSYNDRAREDPRRFTVRYEGRPFKERRRLQEHHESLERHEDYNINSLRHDDRGVSGRTRDKRRRTRSRSPKLSRPFPNQGSILRAGRGGRSVDHSWADRGLTSSREGSSGLTQEQSVSDRSRPVMAASQERRKAEITDAQKQRGPASGSKYIITTAEYVPSLGPQQSLMQFILGGVNMYQMSQRQTMGLSLLMKPH